MNNYISPNFILIHRQIIPCDSIRKKILPAEDYRLPFDKHLLSLYFKFISELHTIFSLYAKYKI